MRLPGILRTEKELHQLLGILEDSDVYALDFETTSLDIKQAKIVGLALGWFDAKTIKATYIPVGHNIGVNADFDLQTLGEAMEPIWMDTEKIVVEWNAKYDERCIEELMLRKIKNKLWDAMIAHYFWKPGEAHDLKMATWKQFKHKMIEFSDVVPRGKTIADVEPKKVGRYAAGDGRWTLEHYRVQVPAIEELGLTKRIVELENPIVRSLKTMEATGIRIDVPYLQGLHDKTEVDLVRLQKDLDEAIGYRVNINSTQQLSKALWHDLNAPTWKGMLMTKTGISTNAANVNGLVLRGFGPAKILQEMKGLSTLQTTFHKPLLVRAKANKEQRIYANFLQHGTITNRYSSSNPNLQNIPRRTERGRLIRAAFCATPGWVIVRADQSQVELRLAAHFSQDSMMLETFLSGGDIHAETMESIGCDRDQAKTINFRLIFGGGPQALADELGISFHQAKEWQAAFFRKYPQLKQFQDALVAHARVKGYVRTLLGFYRYLPDLNSPNWGLRAGAERRAVNTKIQGSNADIMKVCQRNIHQWIWDYGLEDRMHIMIQVHDELVMEARADFVEEACVATKDKMENCVQLRVPLVVDPEYGPNWGNKKEWHAGDELDLSFVEKEIQSGEQQGLF